MKIFIISFLIIIFIYLLITFIMFLLVSVKKNKDFTPMAKAVEETLKPYKVLIDKGNKWVDNKYKNNLVRDIFIKSNDGLKLHGIFIENKKNKGIMIEVHGYRSTAKRDLYPSCYHYYNIGYSLLIIDNRASGLSEGKYITFGIKESDDIICWIKYLNKKYKSTDIVLAGVSMGATSILMAMDKITNKMNVRTILVDCGYVSAYDEVKYCINHYFHIPGILFIDIINFWCKLIGKFDLRGKDTITSMKDSKIPVLFVHGEEDDFVPPFNSKLNYKEYNGKKKLVIFKNATHGISYLVDPSKYVTSIKNFLK